MKAVTRHHTMNAIRFKTQEISNVWAVYGRGITAWPNENLPPQPSVAALTITEPIGAKKVIAPTGFIKWVKPSDVGEFVFTGDFGSQRWTEVVDQEDAIQDGVRHVLIQVGIVGVELPLTSFREVGFFTGLTPIVGHTSDVLIDIEAHPSWVSTYGNLEVLEYRKLTPRQSTSQTVLSAIIEF